MTKKLTWMELTWMDAVVCTTILVGLSIAISTGFTACSAVKASHTVNVTPATRALILEQPEFAEVDCGEARTTVIGADVTKGNLVVSINCIAF